MIEDTAKEPDNYAWVYEIGVGLVGTIFGLVLPYFFNDFMRPYLSSVRTIRDRLQNNLPINRTEEKRIEKFANEVLNNWIKRFKSPNTSKKPFESGSKFIPLEFDAHNEDTLCPSSDYYLYFDMSLFLNQDIHEVTNEDVVNAFKANLRNSDTENGISKKLFNILGHHAELRIWIRMPNYIVKSKEKLIDLYDKLKVVSTDWFPESKLLLELFLPHLFFPEYENAKQERLYEQQEFYYEVGKIVSLQNLAKSRFLEKNVFGHLDFGNSKRIPVQLLENRVKGYDSINESRLIQIEGQPGSGKTELLDYLIRNVIHSNTLIICFNSHDDISDIKEYIGKYDAFVNRILDYIDLNEIFDVSQSESHIVKDVLWVLLNRRSIELLLVIDNLEYSENLYKDILSFLSSKSAYNIKFVLAARVFQPLDKSRIYNLEIKSRLWSYEEALQIVKDWNESAATITSKPWLKSIHSFSTYLLRILSVSNQGVELDELVRNEIEKILKPVLNSITKTAYSADDQISKIKSLPKEGFTKEAVDTILLEERDIDIIKVLGNITMNRIYNYRRDSSEETRASIKNIIPERIIPWSNNMISDIKTAKIFIKSCEASGILNEHSSLPDKFMQDGAAAITIQEDYISDYIRNTAKKNPDKDKQARVEGVVHNLISSLAKKNSLEIFKLSFRVDDLIVVLKSIINSERDKGVLKEILSEDYILFLNRKAENLQILADDLMRTFERETLSKHDKIILANCLARVLKIDKNLQILFKEFISGNNRTELVSSVYAYHKLDSPEVFILFHNTKDKIVLFEYCCRTWSSNAGNLLMGEFLNIANMESSLFDEILNHFTLWVKRQEAGQLLITIDQILDTIPKKDESDRQFLTAISLRIFNELYDNGLLKTYEDRFGLKSYLKKWKNLLKEYTFNRVMKTNELIKMLAYGFDQELCDRSVDYKLVGYRDKNIIYAIPRKQFNKEGIQTVFSRFTDVENFDLPSKDLLSRVYQKSDDAKELINDYIVANDKSYVPFPTMFPNEHKYFDGDVIKGMTNEDINSTRFGWRPVFKL